VSDTYLINGLRALAEHTSSDSVTRRTINHAADRIKVLQAENARLREALGVIKRLAVNGVDGRISQTGTPTTTIDLIIYSANTALESNE